MQKLQFYCLETGIDWMGQTGIYADNHWLLPDVTLITFWINENQLGKASYGLWTTQFLRIHYKSKFSNQYSSHLHRGNKIVVIAYSIQLVLLTNHQELWVVTRLMRLRLINFLGSVTNRCKNVKRLSKIEFVSDQYSWISMYLIKIWIPVSKMWLAWIL